ncbi:hypothetical protein [Leyella stercorea]|uniref:hypothetical protein n=1 Tax=Leyella stercorea TaxID=363265 RepID=UPI002665722B|nr:hypothetical protein [Leyella stercorea]
MHQPSKKCTDCFVGAVETAAPPDKCTDCCTPWSICADRCGHLRRPLRTSASTDADICADRCRHLRRPMQTSASTDA